MSVEAFAATKFNKILSRRQQRRDVKVLQLFRDGSLKSWRIFTPLRCSLPERILLDSSSDS